MSGFNFNLDPIQNFLSLYDEAVQNRMPEPNAMALATVGKDSKPSVRIVFFKGILRDGFSFYTNYQGRKGQDIANNPNVCSNFFWPELERQVRIEGQAQKISRSESETYFKTRARESQLGAWASQQSQKLVALKDLEEKHKELELKFANQDVPCPPHWGGYIIVPSAVEFWFGRLGRLHERYKYTRSASSWERSFLNP